MVRRDRIGERAISDLTMPGMGGWHHLGRCAKENAKIDEKDALRFANESCGSPQLMQAICLQACRVIGLTEEHRLRAKLTISPEIFRTVSGVASLQSDYSSLVSRMHQGPKTRGVERKTFKLTDGSEGDVYRCVLMAIAEDPPTMGLPYQDLMNVGDHKGRPEAQRLDHLASYPSMISRGR